MRDIIKGYGILFFISFLALIVFSANAVAMDAKLTWNPNSETDLAGYKVYYGTSSRLYATPIDVGKQTTYTLTNLPDRTHYFAVTAYDTSGRESAYSVEASKTPPATPDTTPPLISSINASNITSAAAVITWGTNEGADTQVQYGTTTAYGASTPLVTAMVTVHSQALAGLQAGTLYHYRVLSRDASGNLATSLDNTFTTSAAPPPGSSTALLSPASDTFLKIDATANGGATTLNTYTWPANRAANAVLMKFNLSTLPAGAIIQSATLNLSLVEADATADASYTVAVHKLINKNPDLARASGYTYDGTNAWTANACCYNNIPLAQADISAPYDTEPINKTLGVKSWDLTKMVQEWLSSPATNYGLLLNSDATKGADRYRFFASMEHPTASLRPSLQIIYSTSDVAAPVLSGIAVKGILTTGATVVWTSNEPATSQVEYGTTTAYGFRSLLDPTLLTAHTVLLAGLTPSTTYHYRVVSRDLAGNTATSNDAVFTTASPPDTAAPSAPTNLKAAAASSSQINLTWSASVDNVGVSGYRIYRNGVQVGTTASTSYSDGGLAASTSYTYMVSAYDAAGNVSAQTAAVSAVTLGSNPATTVALPPASDTFLKIDRTANGGATTLNTYTWPANRAANAVLMKFNLSTLPAGAIIQSATLNLSLVEADATADASYTVTVHKLINRNPDLARASGYTYDGTNAWTANACCYNNIPLAQADISAPYDSKAIDKTLGVKSWDLTKMVQEWLSSPATNYGLLLNSDATKGADRYRFFASMEHPTASLRPSLQIIYRMP